MFSVLAHALCVFKWCIRDYYTLNQAPPEVIVKSAWLHVYQGVKNLARQRTIQLPDVREDQTCSGVCDVPSVTAAVWWEKFGEVCGLDTEVVEREHYLELQTKYLSESAEKESTGGCSWIRCPFYGEEATRPLLRCSRCRSVRFVSHAELRLTSNYR